MPLQGIVSQALGASATGIAIARWQQIQNVQLTPAQLLRVGVGAFLVGVVGAAFVDRPLHYLFQGVALGGATILGTAVVQVQR